MLEKACVLARATSFWIQNQFDPEEVVIQVQVEVHPFSLLKIKTEGLSDPIART